MCPSKRLPKFLLFEADRNLSKESKTLIGVFTSQESAVMAATGLGMPEGKKEELVERSHTMGLKVNYLIKKEDVVPCW